MTDQYGTTNINDPRRTVTTNATSALNQDASLVIVDTVGLGAPPTITLPNAEEVDGRTVTIKVPVATGGGGGQNVVVDGANAQTIDGSLSVTIAVDQTALTVQSDNANWRIINLTDASSGGEIIFGDLFLDAASPTLTIGDGTGSPVLVLNKSDAGTATFNANVAGVTRWDVLIDASEDFSLERRNGAGALIDAPLFVDITNGDVSIVNQLLLAGAIDTDAAASAVEIVAGDGSGDVGFTLFVDVAGIGRYGVTDTTGGGAMRGGLQINAGGDQLIHVAAGSAVTLVTSVAVSPFADGLRFLGTSLLRWGPSFVNQISYATVVAGDGTTISIGDEKLVQATAPTGLTTLTLPTAVVGDEYFIDAVDITAGIAVEANVGDTINGGAVAGTATISTLGLYHIYAVDGTDWRLHGPVALGPVSA